MNELPHWIKHSTDDGYSAADAVKFCNRVSSVMDALVDSGFDVVPMFDEVNCDTKVGHKNAKYVRMIGRKNGIILLDVTQIKRLSSLAKVDLMYAEQILQELEEINNKKKAFVKQDFFKFVMLKKKFLYIPTKLLLYSKQAQTTKNEIHTALISYVQNKLKRMELLKNKQKGFEGKKLYYDFEAIENLVEQIIESPESFEQPVLDKEEFVELKSKHDDIDLLFKLINR